MNPVTIRPFRPADEATVIDLILSIQRDEFAIPITAEDQPDLRAIPDFYQSGAGAFFVAEAARQIVGTIGLQDIGARHGALRKMFVAPDFRGREHGVARALLDRLLQRAGDTGLAAVFLGTTDRFRAAHRFYEKAGFVAIPAGDLPASFPRLAVDTRFYRLLLLPT